MTHLILGCWLFANFTIAPFAIWRFFRRKRQAEAEFEGWIAGHPDAPASAMPPQIAAAYFGLPVQPAI